METKYYRFGGHFYKLGGKVTEKITLYRHDFGIRRATYFSPDMNDLEEISEAQYMRVKKLILAKHLKS